jgi:hypothetical protein
MLCLQQALIRLFRAQMYDAFWAWCGDTKHKQLEEVRAEAKQLRRDNRRAAIRIQRWYRIVFFRRTYGRYMRKYKVRAMSACAG